MARLFDSFEASDSLANMAHSPSAYALRGCFIDAMARIDQSLMLARICAKHIEPDEIDTYVIRWARIVFVERIDKWLPSMIDIAGLADANTATLLNALPKELRTLSDTRTRLSHAVWNPTYKAFFEASSSGVRLEGTRHDRREIDIHNVSEPELEIWCLRAVKANATATDLARFLFNAGPEDWKRRHQNGP